MANELDELRDPVNPNGRDVNVIEKQLPVKVGFQVYVQIFFRVKGKGDSDFGVFYLCQYI